MLIGTCYVPVSQVITRSFLKERHAFLCSFDLLLCTFLAAWSL